MKSTNAAGRSDGTANLIEFMRENGSVVGALGSSGSEAKRITLLIYS